MNTQTDNTALMPESIEALTTGQQLRSAREEKKLTLEEVAKQLFLSKEIIADLENDDHSKIVAPVYLRGYLVKYARLLQIPMEIILKDFKQTTTVMEATDADGEPIIKILQPIKIDTNQEQSTSYWAMYAAIAIFIIACIVWGYNHYHNSAAIKTIAATKEIEVAKTNMDAATNAPVSPIVTTQKNLTEQQPEAMSPAAAATTTETTTTDDDAQKTSQVTSDIEILPAADEPDSSKPEKTHI
jgi:cytoskeleton protein RodZ